MKYMNLIVLDITHQYFTSKKCTWFDIGPTVATQDILNGLRIKFSFNGSRVTIAVPVEQNSRSYINSNGPLDLEFELGLNNSDFMHITALNDGAGMYPLIFTNSNTSVDGVTVLAQTDGGTALPMGLFGKIRLNNINIGGAPLPDEPQVFRIEFEASRKYWEYFLVTNLEEQQLANVIITDSSSDKSSEIVFNEDPSEGAPSSLLSRLKTQYPDFRVIRFVSQEPVVCSQYARDTLQLFIDDSIVLEHLPNPLLENFNSFTKENVAHSSMYQVLKYVNQSYV